MSSWMGLLASETWKKSAARTRTLALLCGALLMATPVKAQGPGPLPATPKKPVVDEYHGVKVTDDYRWLENWDDPAVRAWSDEQNQRTRAYLDGLAAREPIRRWLREVADPTSEHLILDPNQLNSKGTTAIDFYVPSLDGRYVAASLSEGGSEEGTVHVYDVASGKETGDVIPRVNKGTGGGGVAWNGDGTGFFYTRYPADGERPKEDLDFYQQIYFHKMGAPVSADTYSIGKEFPRIAEILMRTSDDGRYVLAQVANGDGGEFAHYLMDFTAERANTWIQVTHFIEKVSQAVFGKDHTLYLLSRNNAPRGKVLRVPLGKPVLANAETVVPQSEAAIEAFAPSETLLYVIDSMGGPSRVRVFDQKGHAKGVVPTLPASAVYGASSPRGDNLIYNNVSYLTPGAWYRYDPATGKATRTALFQTSPVD